MNSQELIDQLKARREEIGLSKAALSDLTGFSIPTISQMENRRAAQLNNFVRVANALGMEVCLRPIKGIGSIEFNSVNVEYKRIKR